MNRRDFIVRVTRSWPARVILVLLLAALLCLATLAIWQGRQLIAFFATLVLCFIVADLAMASLPLSPTTRKRMTRRQELEDRHPARRYRLFFWIGLWDLAIAIWRDFPGPFHAIDHAVPAFFIGAGLIASLIWRIQRGESKDSN